MKNANSEASLWVGPLLQLAVLWLFVSGASGRRSSSTRKQHRLESSEGSMTEVIIADAAADVFHTSHGFKHIFNPALILLLPSSYVFDRLHQRSEALVKSKAPVKEPDTSCLERVMKTQSVIFSTGVVE